MATTSTGTSKFWRWPPIKIPFAGAARSCEITPAQITASSALRFALAAGRTCTDHAVIFKCLCPYPA